MIFSLVWKILCSLGYFNHSCDGLMEFQSISTYLHRYATSLKTLPTLFGRYSTVKRFHSRCQIIRTELDTRAGCDVAKCPSLLYESLLEDIFQSIPRQARKCHKKPTHKSRRSSSSSVTGSSLLPRKPSD